MASSSRPPSSDRSAMPGEIAARLEQLSLSFSESLSGKVKEVRRIWSLLPDAPIAAESLDALIKIHDIVHTLAGSGKSFGFPAVSAAAAPLDGLFRLLREQNQTLSREEIAQIELLVQGLERAIHQPRVALDLDGLDSVGAAAGGASKVIILAPTAKDANAMALAKSMQAFGRDCDVVQGAKTLPADVVGGRAAIVVVDLEHGESYAELARDSGVIANHPLVVTSRIAGFEERLKAVRMGATTFLPYPVDVESLIAHAATWDESRTERPFRVVIAEDEDILATYYNLTLQHAGMDTRVVRRPSQLLDALSGFDPDLILMDLYMPECSGLELAQIVRQFPAYTTVPILFLSTESRLDLQLKARHLGGDDFLPKPLQPGQLISAVSSRASRYRELKKLTDRDSLTGLLNHSNILRALDRELAAAARTKMPLTVAMVDIDHFKAVNDTYGHAAGDQVIARVTHLLRNRLRRTDIVGRYGGEEFAAVMPNTDAAAARSVLEQLRDAAEKLEHRADGRAFRVTFSAGLSCYPAITDAAALIEAADRALYRAKAQGRNRVVIG